MTFEEWWQNKVDETGYTDPYQDSEQAAREAWEAGYLQGTAEAQGDS